MLKRKVPAALAALCCLLVGCAGPVQPAPTPTAEPTPAAEVTVTPAPTQEVTPDPTPKPTPAPVPPPPELELVLTPPEEGEIWGTRSLLVEYRDEAGTLLFDADLSLPYIPNPKDGYQAVEDFCQEWMDESIVETSRGLSIAEEYAHSDQFYPYYLLDNGGISFSKGNLVLLTIYSEGYLGGVHGYHQLFSACFDIETGEQLHLSDLFSDWDAAREIIWAELDAQAKKSGPPTWADAAESAYEYLSDTTFFLSEDGLTIHYGEYAIASYADGSFAFLIPKDSISHLTAYPIWD